MLPRQVEVLECYFDVLSFLFLFFLRFALGRQNKIPDLGLKFLCH